MLLRPCPEKAVCTRYVDPYLRVEIDRETYSVFDPDLQSRLAAVDLVGEPVAVL